jgi:hypothetical protein
VPALIVGALDPQGHPAAEIVELADLDRGAERAGPEIEAKLLILYWA